MARLVARAGSFPLTLAGAACLAAASALAAGPQITLDPADVRPGSWSVVSVPGTAANASRSPTSQGAPGTQLNERMQAAVPGTIRVLGREIPLYAADGGLRALVPVPLGTPGGGKPVEVVLPGGTMRASLRVLARPEPPARRFRDLTVSDRAAAALKAGNAVLGRAFRQTGPEALWSSPLRWPLLGRTSSPYGVRRSYAGTAEWAHRGIDLVAPVGWPVVAAAAGRVVISRRIEEYGNSVVLDHGQTVHTAYFHMSARAVVEGQRVEAGQVIGTLGATGLATGPNLHFGTYIGAVPVDPEEMLTRGLP